MKFFNGDSKGISTGYHLKKNGDGQDEVRWKPSKSTFWTIMAVLIPLTLAGWGAHGEWKDLEHTVQDTVKAQIEQKAQLESLKKEFRDLQIEAMEQQRANAKYLKKLLENSDPANAKEVIKQIEDEKERNIKETKEKLNPGEG